MSRQFNDILTNLIDKKWSNANNFSAYIVPPQKIIDIVDSTNEIKPDDLTISIKSINLPQFNNQPIEEFIAGEWKFGNGINELQNIDITFRDFDSMKLYRYFTNIYKLSTYHYPADIYFDIMVMKDKDFDIEVDTPVGIYSKCILTAVSQVQFSHDNDDQIVEFDVSFKTNIDLEYIL